MDPRWAGAEADTDPAALAAVLVHETVHARDAASGALGTSDTASGRPAGANLAEPVPAPPSRSVELCVASEQRAFQATARAWRLLRATRGGPANGGEPGNGGEPATALEAQLDEVLRLEQRDPAALARQVEQTYRATCGRA